MKTKLFKHGYKKFVYFCLAVIITLAVSISFQSLLAAWTAPTADPTGGNKPAPINNAVTSDQYIMGSFGIGTTTPSSLLHLYKNINGTNAEIAIQSGNGTIVQNKWAIYQDQAGGDLRFWNTDNRLTITKNGNVGIGTTAPNASLEVKRTISDGNFVAWFEGVNNANYGLGVNIANTTSAKAIADFKSGNVSKFFVRADGNVGIGDTSPVAKLTVGDGDLFQVNGSGDLIKIRNITYSWPSIQGVSNTYLKNDGSGTLSWATTGDSGAPISATYITQTANTTLTNEQALSSLTTGIVKNTTGTGVLSIATAGTDYENPLTFSNGLIRATNAIKLGGTLTATTDIPLGGYDLTFSGIGNVGIGTTTPSEKLHIKGGIKVTSSDGNYSYTISNDGGDLKFFNNNTATTTMILTQEGVLKVNSVTKLP